jgi:hypothetical protein
MLLLLLLLPQRRCQLLPSAAVCYRLLPLPPPVATATAATLRLRLPFRSIFKGNCNDKLVSSGGACDPPACTRFAPQTAEGKMTNGETMSEKACCRAMQPSLRTFFHI